MNPSTPRRYLKRKTKGRIREERRIRERKIEREREREREGHDVEEVEDAFDLCASEVLPAVVRQRRHAHTLPACEGTLRACVGGERARERERKRGRERTRERERENGREREINEHSNERERKRVSREGEVGMERRTKMAVGADAAVS